MIKSEEEEKKKLGQPSFPQEDTVGYWETLARSPQKGHTLSFGRISAAWEVHTLSKGNFSI